MSIRRISAVDEWRVWWALDGELRFDLLTYYGVCCTVGYLQGYAIGRLIVSGYG